MCGLLYCKHTFEGTFMVHAINCPDAQAYYAKRDADKHGKGKY